MIENFEAYIDSIGPLSDEELFEDIDETMARKGKWELAPITAGKVGE
jgi:hypothetical protein